MKRFLPVFLVLLASCGGAAAPAPSPAAPKPSAAGAKPAASATEQLIPMKFSNVGVSGGVQPLWIALDGGYFRKNGLDVAADSLTTSSSATVAALVSGQIQVAWTDGTSAVNANAGGADLKVVSTIHPGYSYLIMAAPEIKRPEDLKGQKIAVSSLTGTDAVATKLALTKLGIDWQKDVALVATGDNASRTAALLGGSVQATLQEPPGTLVLEDKGFHPVADLTPMNLPSVNASLIVSGSYLAQNRPAVQKFVDSIVEANARLRKDKPYAVSLLKKYFKSDDDRVMGIVYDHYLPNTPVLPFPKAELFTAAVEELSRENPKLKQIDLKQVVDASFVQSAADRKLDQT